LKENLSPSDASRLKRQLRIHESTAKDKSLSSFLRASANLEAGRIHYQLGDPEEALSILSLAGEEFEQSDDSSSKAQAGDAYILAAQMASEINDKASRVQLLQRAYNCYKAAGNAARVQETEQSLGELRAAPAPAMDAAAAQVGAAGLNDFLDLEPDQPLFWETVNTSLNPLELEKELSRSKSSRLAETIHKSEEVAGLWEKSISKKEQFQALLDRLIQNAYLRRKSSDAQTASAAEKSDRMKRRGPVTNLLSRSSPDPTQSTLMERLGNLEGSCISMALKRVLPTIAILFLVLLGSEVAIFALIALHSGWALGTTFPLLTIWPPTAFLIGFLGGERFIEMLRNKAKTRKTQSIWSPAPVRLGIYLVVLIVVEVFWFGSDIANTLFFHTPGILITSSGPNLIGILATVLVFGALGLILTFLTFQQKANSVKWTSVGGTLAYAVLTLTLSVASIGSLVSVAGSGFSSSSFAGTVKFLGGIPMYVLAGFGGVLVIIMLVPFLAHRLEQGALEDRLRVGQTLLDDMDALPKFEGEQRMPAMSALSQKMPGNRLRKVLDFSFHRVEGQDIWDVTDVKDAEGHAEAHLVLDLGQGRSGYEFFLAVKPAAGVASTEDSGGAGTPVWERTDLDGNEAWKKEINRLVQAGAQSGRGYALPVPTSMNRQGASYQSLLSLVTEPSNQTWRLMLHNVAYGTSRDKLVRYGKYPPIILLNELLLRAAKGEALQPGAGMDRKISTGSVGLFHVELNRLAGKEEDDSIPQDGWKFGPWTVTRTVESGPDGELVSYRAQLAAESK
jgi:tetratricopeptide (TPR) repeat protein